MTNYIYLYFSSPALLKSDETNVSFIPSENNDNWIHTSEEHLYIKIECKSKLPCSLYPCKIE